jgi:hypothetical protein
MTIETITTLKIIADEGKVFKRIFDNQLCGSVIHLGYTYYIGGRLLDEPFLEKPEYFTEIDDPSLINKKE